MTSLSSLQKPLELYEAFDEKIGDRNVYGDDALFQRWKAEQLQKTVDQFAKQVKQPGYFFAWVLELGKARGEIAAQMGSRDADLFGAPRFNDKKCMLTHLTAHRYRGYDQKLRAQFLDYLPLFQYNVNQCAFNQPQSRYTIEKFDQKKLAALIDSLRTPHFVTDEEKLAHSVAIDLVNCIGSTHDLAKHLYPELALPQYPTLGAMQLLVGTSQVLVNGTWRTLSRHLTWYIQEATGPIQPESVKRFNQRSFTTIVHTPRFLVPLLPNALEPLTTQLLTHRYPSREAFCKDLAQWEFLFFNSMPFQRGSAAVAEIVRDAICQIQKLPPTKTMDLDAMTEPFLESYASIPLERWPPPDKTLSDRPL